MAAQRGPLPEHEYEQRVEHVLEWVLAGLRTSQICQAASQKWGVGPRSANRYLRSARTLLFRNLEQHRDALLAEHIAARRDLRRRARQAKDMRVELEVMRDEAKLLGIYPADKIDVNATEVNAKIESLVAALSGTTDAAVPATPEAAQEETVH